MNSRAQVLGIERAVLDEHETRRGSGGWGLSHPVQRLHDGQQEGCDNGAQAG